MFLFPKKAEFNGTVAKAKIYNFAKPSRRVKDRFVSEIDSIVWKYKLSPETTNLSARRGVEEIQVFEIALKRQEACGDLLRVIDQAMAFPTFFLLRHGDSVKTVAAYKRPNEADSTKWVTDGYFSTAWQDLATLPQPLPVAIDLAALYEGMLRQILPLPARTGESLRDHVERIARIRILERDHLRLETGLEREKQFNRKVELNRQLRDLKLEIASLASSAASLS